MGDISATQAAEHAADMSGAHDSCIAAGRNNAVTRFLLD